MTTMTIDVVPAIINTDRMEFVNREFPLAVKSGLIHGPAPETLSLRDKASGLEVVLRKSPKVEELLLYDYIERGSFWNAGISLERIKQRIANWKYHLYAEVIKSQAMQNKTGGGADTGHAWLVEAHKKGWLKGHISEGELKECVNEGFWELMNEYFYPPHAHITVFSKVPDIDKYNTLMSYSQHLDLSRAKEFREKFGLIEPLEWRKGYADNSHTSGAKYDWPDSKYKDAVAVALGNEACNTDTAAWLLCPIIEQILYREDNQPCSSDEVAGIRELEPYKKYLDEPDVKSLIQQIILHFRDEYGY